MITDSPITPERDQALAYAIHPVGTLVPLVAYQADWYIPRTSPPNISPGISSILRI